MPSKVTLRTGCHHVGTSSDGSPARIPSSRCSLYALQRAHSRSGVVSKKFGWLPAVCYNPRAVLSAASSLARLRVVMVLRQHCVKLLEGEAIPQPGPVYSRRRVIPDWQKALDD